jgi:hypothetical protein
VGAGGFGATFCYIVVAVLPGPAWLLVLVGFGFAAALSAGSVAIWQVLALGGQNSPPALLGAVANVVAGALFVAMVLVQLAIKDVQDPPEDSIRAVYWGLDVAWDLYIGAGTLAFAVAFLYSRLFRWLALPGGLIALALIGLNIATFPEPPGTAGLIDVGPLVGLWYLAVTIRALNMGAADLETGTP